MTIELMSYGRTNGAPNRHFTRVWNIESLPNAPPELRRHHNGLHPLIRQSILSTPAAQVIIREALETVRFNDRARLAFACTRGLHRSVAIVEAIAENLRLTHTVRVNHRDLYADKRHRIKSRRKENSRRAKKRAVRRKLQRRERNRARRHEPSFGRILLGRLFERDHRY